MRSAPFAAAAQITNMGPTEVGFTTNFSTVDYTWQRIEDDSRLAEAEEDWSACMADAGYDFVAEEETELP